MAGFRRPVWVEEGPGPLTMPTAFYTKAAGAIQALALDPLYVERIFVATVGGGIWMSNDLLSPDPTWTPLTDYAPSLSMSAIAFSPLDPARNTLYAGCGRTSHSDPLVGANVGPLYGILKTTDGGTTWLELARDVFAGDSVNRILPTRLTVPVSRGPKKFLGEVVLIGTDSGGLFRSVDSGFHWTGVKGIPAPVTDIATEVALPTRIYVAGGGRLFRSEDGGYQNWTEITPAAWTALPWWAQIRLSISPQADVRGNHWLYAGVGLAPHGFGLFFTPDHGTTWYEPASPPDCKWGPLMAASPWFNDVVFCACDKGSPDHYMVKAADGAAAQWTLVEGDGANGTGPHTDGRDCVYSAQADTLYETNDGGIYALINPHGFQGIDMPARQWVPLVGNIRTAEFHAIAYDSINHTLFGATQDNSIPHQTSQGGLDWELNEDAWGDGFEVGVDDRSTPGASVHYSSQQNLFHFNRETFTSPQAASASVGIPVVINGTGGRTYNQVEGALGGALGTIRWNQSWRINRSDPKRILLGTNYLYESFDRGDTFTSLGGLAKNNAGDWIPANPVGRVTAYAYGHDANPDVIYIGAGGALLVRAGSSGLPTVQGTYPGSSPVGIALDPQDWRRAYVLDDAGSVWRTFDAGATAAGWNELTGNLPSLTSDLRTIEVVPRPDVGADEAVFVGGYGGVFLTLNPGDGQFAFWTKHGANLPNAVVTGIQYSDADKVLIAGTLGRSAWSLRNVPDTIVGAPWLRIKDSGQPTCLGGWLENSVVTFTYLLHGLTDLVLPLTYAWAVQGAAPASPLDGMQISVTMPSSGAQVVVELTITDAEGYQVHAVVAERVISVAEAALIVGICERLQQLRTRLRPNWPIHPLGPDPGPVRPVFRPDYADLEKLAVEIAEIAGRLRDVQRGQR